MKLFDLDALCSLLLPIKDELALLKFWKEYPEIGSIVVGCTFEYNDEGRYYSRYSIEEIKFVSSEMERNLAHQLFTDSKLEEIKSYDWEEVIAFPPFTGLEPGHEIYVRPQDVEVQIAKLQQQVKNHLLSSLKGSSLYAVVEPIWEYNDEYYYIQGTELIGIYANAESASDVAKQRNLATVANHSSEDLGSYDLFDGNDPDKCKTVEEKLTLWEEYADNFLTSVSTVKLQ